MKSEKLFINILLNGYLSSMNRYISKSSCLFLMKILQKFSANKDDVIIIPQSSGLLFVALIFIGLYSFLPHKELRFIIYVLPVLNLVVADIWTNLDKPMLSSKGGGVYTNLLKKKSLPKRITVTRLLLILCCYSHLLMNAACSLLLTKAAQNNYPGGEALNTLNHMEHLIQRNDVHVHICNLAAQTGVTRFLQIHDKWIYNKTEGIEKDFNALNTSNFTHLISEISSIEEDDEEVNQKPLSSSFKRLYQVNSFNGIQFHANWNLYNLLEFKSVPRLFIYERINFTRT
ncbi:unnamed protein product [Trichobilharzia szidati]|nr:unnamed protein product [Trichobilharzia szidati]